MTDTTRTGAGFDATYLSTWTEPDEVVRLAAAAHTTIAAGIEAVLAAMS